MKYKVIYNDREKELDFRRKVNDTWQIRSYTSIADKQQYMLQRVGELIKIYQSCQYPPLYGYLCNIFCSVAVCEYDETHGMTRQESIDEVRTAMESFMLPSRKKYEKLFSIGFLWPLLRWLLPKLMCSANGHGFETRAVKGPKNLLAFDTTECIFATILNGLGRNDWPVCSAAWMNSCIPTCPGSNSNAPGPAAEETRCVISVLCGRNKLSSHKGKQTAFIVYTRNENGISCSFRGGIKPKSNPC